MSTIFLSLMAADQLNLEHEIKKFEVYCDGFHIDVMDNHFVPNLAFGTIAINQIARATNKPLSIHLMVTNPEQVFEQLHLRPGTTVTFHLEAAKYPDRLIKKIIHKECKASIAIGPRTKLELLNLFLSQISQVLVMGVEPGFSGQEFIPETVNKIETISILKKAKQLPFLIGVDGGVELGNIKQLAQLGVDTFYVASAVFDADDQLTALEKLYDQFEN